MVIELYDRLFLNSIGLQYFYRGRSVGDYGDSFYIWIPDEATFQLLQTLFCVSEYLEQKLTQSYTYEILMYSYWILKVVHSSTGILLYD